MQPPRPPDTFRSGQQSSQSVSLGSASQNYGQPDLVDLYEGNQDQYSVNTETTQHYAQQDGMNESCSSEITPNELRVIQKNKKRIKTILVLILFFAVGLFFRYRVLSIRSIRIIGNCSQSSQEIAKSAGLDRSLFYFAVKEENIKEKINSNRYLIFRKMEKIFPNTLHIEITERRPFAFFTHLGIGYVIAQDGIILEQGRDLSQGHGLIQISGLSVWGQMRLGSLPTTTDPAQMEELTVLFSELKVWGFWEQVKQVDLAQALNISLITNDGYTINLGNVDDLHAKIGTVQSVVRELRKREMKGGIIEVTLPGEATYLVQNQ